MYLPGEHLCYVWHLLCKYSKHKLNAYVHGDTCMFMGLLGNTCFVYDTYWEMNLILGKKWLTNFLYITGAKMW